MRKAFLALLLPLAACSNKVEDAVRHDMLDPDAAQFRDVDRCEGDSSVWRGNVNGKNAMGAYTGFKPFFYDDGVVAFAEDAQFSGLMSRCYSNLKADLQEHPSAPPSEPSAAAKAGGVEGVAKPDEDPQDFDSEDATIDSPNLATSMQCWADYCPCDSSDPDYGYLDVTLCRKIKMGMPVSDDEFDIGASSRDARRALREFKRDNP